MIAAPIPHQYSDRERRIALAAVLIVLLLSALDQTIVATAMQRIVAELRGLDRIAWVGTAYLLASTVVVPIYGKLGDIYGRRPVMVFGVLVFLLGSMLCGLIVASAVPLLLALSWSGQGIGNSIRGLFPVATAILLLAFLVTLTVPALKLRGREAPLPREAPVAAATAA